MSIVRLAGLFAIIPAALLLTVSFFVLFTLRRIEEQGLKAFGYVIVTLLVIAALLIFSVGAYTIYTGRHPMMSMMQGMMQGGMSGMMGGRQMPAMKQGQKQMMMKDKMPVMMPSQTDEVKIKR